VHNAQNNRRMIAELVIEIPHDKYETDNKNIITEITNTKEKLNDSNMNIASSKQSKMFLDSNVSNNSNAYITLQENTIVYEEAAESHGDIKYEDVDIKNESIKIMMMENSSDCMTNNLEKLNTNPNLEQIVMEVILGSSDTNNTKQADSSEVILKTDNNIKDNNTKNNENNTACIVESKEKSYTSVSPNNLKKQRPMRNRMKALNTDFVYDLKKIGKSMLFREKRTLFNDCEALDVRKKSKLYK